MPYLQSWLKCFQCSPLSALARPSPPLTFDVQSSDNMTVWAEQEFMITRSCLLFLLGGRGRSPSHEDVMPIWHSPVSRPDTNLQHVTLEQTFPHCDNQEWSGFEPGQPERERGKAGHHIHPPMTRSTKDQHTQRVFSCQPDAYFQSWLKWFQCPPLFFSYRMAKPSKPIFFPKVKMTNEANWRFSVFRDSIKVVKKCKIWGKVPKTAQNF